MIYKYDAKKAKEIQNLSIQVFWKSAKGLLLNNSLNNVGLQWNWHTTFVVLSPGCINTGLVDLGEEDLDGFFFFKKAWTPCNTCIFSLFLFLFLVGFFSFELVYSLIYFSFFANRHTYMSIRCGFACGFGRFILCIIDSLIPILWFCCVIF